MKPIKREMPREIKDLRDMVMSSAAIFGNKDIYIWKDKETKEEKHYSFVQLRDDVEQFGTAIKYIDLLGKHIAVIGETSAKYTVAYLGTVNTNSVIVPLDRELSTDAIADFLAFADCEGVVYSSSFKGEITKNAAKLPKVRWYIPMDGDDEVDASLPHSPAVMKWDDLMALGLDALNNKRDHTYYSRNLDKEKMCAIIFTSGTTGTSKGAMLCLKNLEAATWASCRSTAYDRNTPLVSALPQHHTYEMTCSHLAVINLGCTEYLNDSLKYFSRSLKEFKPTALVLVPLFIETMHKKIWDGIKKQGLEKKVRRAMKTSDGLLKMGVDLRRKFFAEIHENFGGSLRSIISGGAPISPAILRDFESWGITIFEGYGITECAPLVACNPNGAARFGSVGQPVFRCSVRLEKEPIDESGEICVKGDNVFLGYYNNELASRRAFTRDYWFRTGDLGRIDSDGYIWLTGRKKNVIILSNGKNVYPEELEEHLSVIDEIRECIVVGRRPVSEETAPKNGDEPESASDLVITAMICPDYDKLKGKSDEEIEAYFKERVNDVNRTLPSFKHMTAVEIRHEEFEKTTSMKIKRFLYQ